MMKVFTVFMSFLKLQLMIMRSVPNEKRNITCVKGGNIMTHNQIDFARYKEEGRHNQQTEELGMNTLQESKRHNIAGEQLGLSSLAEQVRHNKRSESIGFGNIGLGYANLGESTRHNIASESIANMTGSASANQSNAQAELLTKQANEYERTLAQRDRELTTAAANAQSNAQKAQVDQQRYQLEKELQNWRKFGIASEGFKDFTQGTRNSVEAFTKASDWAQGQAFRAASGLFR